MVDDETSFNLRVCLLALMEDRVPLLARMLKKACDGIGTDEDMLVYILGARPTPPYVTLCTPLCAIIAMFCCVGAYYTRLSRIVRDKVRTAICDV